jgi:4a-hydroxytetrahydrobiopterin dehydratase
MEILSDTAIAAEGLADWRKLGQGLHARYRTDGLAAGARLVAAVADEVGDHLRVTSLGRDHVDLKLISPDATYREHVVEYATQRDVELARRVSEVAAAQGLTADPAGVTTIELALDTAHSSALAPVWSALLTGGGEATGRGSTDDDVRDATGRVPILWFQETEEHEPPRQRFHLDVWVAPECAEDRIAAAVAAGATVVDTSHAPTYTVLADQDGNKACVCTAS